MVDLTTNETTLLSVTAIRPKIHDGKIVYAYHGDNIKKVVMYDIEEGISETIVDTSDMGAGVPASIDVCGDWVVFGWYAGNESDYQTGIYAYNLVEELMLNIDYEDSAIVPFAFNARGIEVYDDVIYYTAQQGDTAFADIISAELLVVSDEPEPTSIWTSEIKIVVSVIIIVAAVGIYYVYNNKKDWKKR
jgi:hypothetical protein